VVLEKLMIASLIATLTHLFAPWNALYANSKVAESIVTSLHLIAMMIGGGLAIAADRETLRVTRTSSGMGPETLARLTATHRPVLLALTVLLLTGLALATADIETFAHSAAFLVKLSLVALLVTNGAVLVSTEQKLRRGASIDRVPRLWRRLRLTARLSLVLWVCTVIAGAILVNAG
jgi:uncharacterized membrane protein